MKLLASALLALVACATPAILEAPSGPGTSRPCGNGVVCLTPQGTESGFCCPSENVCGGQQPDTFETCEPGFCCFIGPGDGFASRAPRKQTRAK